MTTIQIPKTPEGVRDKLDAVGKIVTAKQRERAALVASVVRLGEGQGRQTSGISTRGLMSANEFARLGIHGLRSSRTVRVYVHRWLEANGGEYPEMGVKVTLPEHEWDEWEVTRTGTDGYESPGGAQATINRIIEKHGPQVIVPAVRRPDVAKAVVDDGEAHIAVVRDSNQRERTGTHTPAQGEGVLGGVADAIHKALIQVGAIAFESDAKTMYEAMRKRHLDNVPWRPNEREALLRCIDEGLRLGALARDLARGVTDADLAELLDQSK